MSMIKWVIFSDRWPIDIERAGAVEANFLTVRKS
jgi:hypothetical protein